MAGFAGEGLLKVHYWAGDFTSDRVRKLACGKALSVPHRENAHHNELRECDDLDELKSLPIEDLCVGCRKRLFARKKV